MMSLSCRGHAFTSLVIALTILVGGCEFSSKSVPTSPSEFLRAFLGSWNSGTASSLAGSSCSNFQWTVTEVQGTTVRGNFSAVCMGNITLSGTATGTLDGELLRWTASGAATAPDAPSCPFTLSGTAARQSDETIRVDYAGQTCLGPVSGTQILNRS